jgi:hypothetical protein
MCGSYLSQLDWLSQPEAEDRFSRNIHIPVAGEGSARGAGACSGKAADEQANASRGNAADQHA